jgi:hypothetical protein
VCLEPPRGGHGRKILGIWYKIFCRAPILATHPQGHKGPFVGHNPLIRLPNVRLGVGEPSHGVG